MLHRLNVYASRISLNNGRRLAGYTLAPGYSTPKWFIKFTYAAWLGGDLRVMPSHLGTVPPKVLHKVHVCGVAWLNDTPRLETGNALASWLRCFID